MTFQNIYGNNAESIGVISVPFSQKQTFPCVRVLEDQDHEMIGNLALDYQRFGIQNNPPHFVPLIGTMCQSLFAAGPKLSSSDW